MGAANPIRWQAEALWEAVAPRLPGFTVEVLPEVDSTNSELMRRARAGQTEPVLLVAERQTAGRGRLGRAWHSQGAPAQPPDGGLPALTFSLGLSLAPRDWSGLSLAVGTSLAESLHPQVQIKWPNDLWLQGRKLAGILIETAGAGGSSAAGRYAVVGVGINLHPRPADGLSTAPAWLQERVPQIDAPQALQCVLAPLVQALVVFEAEGFAPFQARFQARDALRDQAVLLSDGTAGTACGVGGDGALLVHTSAGMKQITSSEVSVRPAGAASA
ncbi:MAG: biotin--[acetyl-CoA-carboxylase] ligase [Ramlibacter sp.]|nr:biotin--[acetyl-CoA-carboxylase] ligase [Ramlibacter sp.]